MSEVIAKLTSDHIKVKGGEYVRDLVRCGECNAYMADRYAKGWGICIHHQSVVKDDDFCSYGEVRDE